MGPWFSECAVVHFTPVETSMGQGRQRVLDAFSCSYPYMVMGCCPAASAESWELHLVLQAEKKPEALFSR